MTTIDIDPEQIIKIGDNIKDIGVTFDREVDIIYGIVDDLKRAWTGKAAEGYVKNIESYKTDFTKFATLIVNFGKLLEEIGTKHKDLENSL